MCLMRVAEARDAYKCLVMFGVIGLSWFSGIAFGVKDFGCVYGSRVIKSLSGRFQGFGLWLP